MSSRSPAIIAWAWCLNTSIALRCVWLVIGCLLLGTAEPETAWSPAQRFRRGSSGGNDDVLDLRHVAPGGRGGLVRGAPRLAGVHVGGIPVGPCVRRGDGL